VATVAEEFLVREFPNGLTFLGQRMEQVSSAAMSLVTPCGASHDDAGCEGAAAIASEWCLRGAGGRDTRQLNDALDALGCQHGESALSEHIQFSAAALGRNLPAVLEIYADILRRPRLEDSTFEHCRALVLQELAGLEDEPMQKCSLLLRERFYPYPLGRNIYGTVESLQAMSVETGRRHVHRGLTPRGTILAVAGEVDLQGICDQAERLFGDWECHPQEPVRTTAAPGGVTRIDKESAQVHIAMAHPAAPMGDSRYYAARVAETVLSGGMSGRLFTEVREKRGLVYTVSTRYHSLKGYAGMFTYAATVPQKAQSTFEVTLRELQRLGEGIEPEEMTKARTQLRSALVMQGESTHARATAVSQDWYHLRRLRGLREISDNIEKVAVEGVLEYLRDFPARNFTVLVIGPEGLDTASLNA
jgi:predicted Zn-dependent peptidase